MTLQPTPLVPDGGQLNALAAASGRAAWAVGEHGGQERPLIERFAAGVWRR